MGPKCNIIVDSCCDLPLEMVQVDGVTIMNFVYIIDDEIYPDDFFQSVGVTEFYDMIRNGATPTTSQVSPAILDATFRAACESGIPTVYFSMSSGISSNYESAANICKLVKDDYPEAELYVVDTHIGCTPEGLLVLEAIRQREKGLTASEMVEWANEAVFNINTMFMVDDLDALHRGGRVPGSVATVGEKLNVKPLLNFAVDGTLGLVGAARGRKKGIKQLAKFYEEVSDKNSPTVLIGNADCPEEAEKLKKEILSCNKQAEVIIHSVGTTIGSHVGAGMVSMSCWGKDRRESMSIADRIANKVKKN